MNTVESGHNGLAGTRRKSTSYPKLVVTETDVFGTSCEIRTSQLHIILGQLAGRPKAGSVVNTRGAVATYIQTLRELEGSIRTAAHIS